MTVQEWQEQFLSMIYDDKNNNIFPASLIKMVATASNEDTEKCLFYLSAFFICELERRKNEKCKLCKK